MKSWVLAGTLLLLACSKSSDNAIENSTLTVTKSGAVRITDPAQQPLEQKFLSASNAGNWDKQKADHAPLVAVMETYRNKEYRVTANTPFANEGVHYVEHLILLNHRQQEIAKVTFPKGSKETSAVFKLVRNPEDRYFVVSKCSMHDSWISEVNLPPLKKDGEL